MQYDLLKYRKCLCSLVAFEQLAFLSFYSGFFFSLLLCFQIQDYLHQLKGGEQYKSKAHTAEGELLVTNTKAVASRKLDSTWFWFSEIGEGEGLACLIWGREKY